MVESDYHDTSNFKSRTNLDQQRNRFKSDPVSDGTISRDLRDDLLNRLRGDRKEILQRARQRCAERDLGVGYNSNSNGSWSSQTANANGTITFNSIFGNNTTQQTVGTNTVTNDHASSTTLYQPIQTNSIFGSSANSNSVFGGGAKSDTIQSGFNFNANPNFNNISQNSIFGGSQLFNKNSSNTQTSNTNLSSPDLNNDNQNLQSFNPSTPPPLQNVISVVTEEDFKKEFFESLKKYRAELEQQVQQQSSQQQQSDGNHNDNVHWTEQDDEEAYQLARDIWQAEQEELYWEEVDRAQFEQEDQGQICPVCNCGFMKIEVIFGNTNSDGTDVNSNSDDQFSILNGSACALLNCVDGDTMCTLKSIPLGHLAGLMDGTVIQKNHSTNNNQNGNDDEDDISDADFGPEFSGLHVPGITDTGSGGGGGKKNSNQNRNPVLEAEKQQLMEIVCDQLADAIASHRRQTGASSEDRTFEVRGMQLHLIDYKNGYEQVVI